MTRSTTQTQPLRWIGVALLVVALTQTLACDSPDTAKEFSEFGTATESYRGGGDSDAGVSNAGVSNVAGSKVDFSGEYFLAAATSLGPTRPLFLQVTVDVSDDLSTIDFVFQPVVNDIDATGAATSNPRTPVGDPVTVTGVAFNDTGNFEVQLDNIVIDGAANPITGRDIRANLTLIATVGSNELFCGNVAGDVVEPIEAPLTTSTSTFGAQLIADDINALEVVFACPEGVSNDTMDAGMDGGDMDTGDMDGGDMDADMDGGGDEFEPRCPEGLAGDYNLYFKTALQSEANDVLLRLEDSGDPTTCYTGAMISKTDGTSEIAEVVSTLDRSSVLTIEIVNFVIPPGATDSLPAGGTANIQLRALQWSASGLCGELTFALFEPLMLGGEGSFAAVDNDDDNLSIDGEFCDQNVTRTEACGFEDLAGRYVAWYITQTQIDQGADPTELRLVLEPNPVTCLQGYFESVTNPGEILNPVYFATAAEGNADLPVIHFRNFVIPPGANPILPNGGRSDIIFTSTQEISENASFCGDLTFSLFEPFPLVNDGFFSIGLEDSAATDGPRCPE